MPRRRGPYPVRVSSRKTRARAIDRDTHVEVIEAAYADGQLTREEYDERVSAALQAVTLTDLDRLTGDLQGARVAPRPAAPPVRTTPASSAQKRGLAIGAAVAAAVLVFFFLLVDTSPQDSATSGQVEVVPAEVVNPLTQGGYEQFLAALQERQGDLVVFSVNLIEGRALVTVPVDATSQRSESLSWNGVWGEPGTGTADGDRLDLARIDPGLVTTAVEEVDALVREPERDQTALSLGAPDPDRPEEPVCVRASSGNRYAERGHQSWTCSGTLLDSSTD